MTRPWPIPQPLARCLVAVVIVLGGGQAALALPEGMVVQGGQLELQQPDANNALLRQGTGRAAADFNSFNIDAGQRLQILQPDASSTLLGRVLNGQITEIHGRLDANGRVLLINPAGVLVGPGGVVNTAAFTATTLHVDHQRFLQGGTVELKSLPGHDPRASVINRGTITVSDGGFAALIAPNVLNDGLITARLGQIQLASGTAATLDISGDGLLSVALDPAVAGTITNNGSLRASHVRLGGGDAAVLAAATVQQNGLIEARNINELLGGRITIEGQHISVGRGAVLDASGANGGGTILVGGSWQNSDPGVRQATTTTIAAGAVLDASATDRGDGGTVVAWSDLHNPAGVTSATGNLMARGGTNGGNGGRIETSGRLLQTQDIQIDASAPLGRGGEWLIDPYNINIIASPPTTGDAFNNSSPANPYLYRPTTADSAILASAVTAQLDAGTSVTISTGAIGSAGGSAGDITVSAPISSNGNATLRLEAARDIAINNPITLSNSNGSLVLQAGGSITQAPNQTLNIAGTTTATATSDVALSRPNVFGGLLNLQANAASIRGMSGLRLGNVSTVSSLSLSAFGGGISTSGTAVSLGGSTLINFSEGDVTLNVTGAVQLAVLEATGNLTLTTTGNVSQWEQVRIRGNTTINAGGANVTLTNASNDFTGVFSASNVNNLSLLDRNNLTLGAITTTGNVSLGGSSISLGGNLTTNRGAINIDNGSGGNTAVLLGSGVVIDTTNSSSTPSSDPGAGVTLRGSIAGIPSSSHGLTIKGGNTGDVLITGTVGAVGAGNTAPSALVISGNDISVASLDGVGAISIAAADGTGADTGSITLTGTTYRAVTSLEIASGIRVGNNPLTNSILLNGGGATTLSTRGGANLEISGSINLNGLALTLDSTAAGAVAAGGTIYVNDAIEGPGSLSINAGTTGVASINHLSGAIGATTPLTGVTLTNANVAGFNRNISAGTLTLNASNAITLQGQLTLTGGLITTANPYAIKLWSGSNTHSTVAGSTSFLNTGALELGDAGGDAFTFAGGVVATAPASIRLVGTIGSTSGAITLGDANTTVNVIAATVGGTSTGAISLGPITLAEGGGLTVGTGIANSVYLSSVSGSTSDIHPETLTINTSSAATIDGAISNLGTLTITNAAGITFNGASITTTGNQSYVGPITLGANTTLTGSSITLGSTVNGSGYSLTLIGNAIFTDNLSSISSLAVSGTSTINAASITTTGNQSYSGLVTLGNANPTLTGSTPTFTAGIDGLGKNLTLNFSGTTVLSGSLFTTDLANLTIGNAGQTTLSGTLTTSGSQTYNNPITLGANTTLTGSSITLGSTVNGSGYSLDLTGNAIFNGALSSLSSLTVNGTSAINAASITTAGQQTYNGAITLLSNTALSSTTGSEFSFGSAINGARALTVSSSGGTTFLAAIGSATPLAGLTINAGTTGEVKFDVNTTVNGNIAATARNIKISADVVSTGGDISLVGDAGAPLSGTFHGVHINGSGVEVKTLATNLIAGANGAISIQGRGGSLTVGSDTDTTHGVYLQAGAVISAGGTGNVSVTGIGGTSTIADNSSGVLISNSTVANGISEIRTAGGSITVTGAGGGTADVIGNYGVIVKNFGRIAAGGSGSATVTGTAIGGTGNAGVFVINNNNASRANPTAAITSAGGTITITGSGSPAGAEGVVVRNAGRVSSGGSGSITVVADSLVLDTNSSAAAGSITAGSSGSATATIRPRTAGTLIDLGGTDVLSGSPLTLGLSTAEIARITAGTLVVGSDTAGAITVSQPLQLASAMNLSLLSGSGLNIAAALGTTSGGTFTATLGGAIAQTALLNIAGGSTIATGSADALLTNAANSFAGAFAFSGRSLQLASSSPLNFAASSFQADLNVTTANAAISQSGPLTVRGLTSITTGTGSITLLDPGNLFSVVPLTISSSGLIQIVPCSATNSCNNDPIPDTAQVRQDILTSNPGLTQSNQVSSIQAQTDPSPAPAISSRSPEAPGTQSQSSGTQAIGSGRQQLNLGQGNLDFNAEESSCADAQGCGGSGGGGGGS